jgi:hypothetical protein
MPGGRTFLPLDHADEVAGEITAAIRDLTGAPNGMTG